ncbi:fibroleukin-like [Pecten maximus]|uniref:fibroleukin-like n=1 Tax=Pecten maximus TaxID=6579 RepID=UPI001457FC84|nr:fibroleukin-like [Pecten maximus]
MALPSIVSPRKMEQLHYGTAIHYGCSVFDPAGTKSIQLSTGVCVKVLCATNGYTVSQQRFDGSESFNRTWDEYKEGFGDISGEFWMGNDLLHYLTNIRPRMLRIEMENWFGVQKYAEYTTFSVANETFNYRLTLSGFSGNIVDMFSGMHDGQEFSTVDRDNDVWVNGACAELGSSGWWYKQCYTCNLNGLYMEDLGVDESQSFIWFFFTTSVMARPLKESRMMFK